MSIRRIWVLFKKELLQGPRGFIFIWAVIMPLVLSFVMAAVFGTLASDEPKLGVYDRGNSELTVQLENYESIKFHEYTSESALKDAVEVGSVDMGIVLPADFDAWLTAQSRPDIQAYIWGESQAKNRTILSVTIAGMVRDLSGQDSAATINTVLLGDGEEVPWSARVLPLIMLFAVFLGGVFIPATSLIEEKTKRTLTALIVTPVNITEVFVSKGLLGFLLAMIVGVIVLAVNSALGAHPLLLILTLALGAIMAVEIGMIFGAWSKDISTLFAMWKTSGILLMGPAFIYMIPAVPNWIGRFFPTYYMLEPLMNITQSDAAWADIALNVIILAALDVVVFVALMYVLRRSNQFG